MSPLQDCCREPKCEVRTGREVLEAVDGVIGCVFRVCFYGDMCCIILCQRRKMSN